MRYRTYKKDQWELHWMSCGMSQCQILVRTLKQHRELKTSNLAGTTSTVLDTTEHTPKKKNTLFVLFIMENFGIGLLTCIQVFGWLNY